MWPKRLKLSEFQKVGFAGKPPCQQTLKNQIDRGEIPGEKLGTAYFVWVDQYLNLADPVDSGTVAAVGTGNRLVDEIGARFVRRLEMTDGTATEI